MNEELTNLLEGIETANNIQQYEEGLGDQIHKAGNAIKNLLGTKAGAAQRAQADAQKNLQTAQANQQANQMNAEANQVDDVTLATQINKLLTTALKNANKNLTNVNDANMQAQADRGEAKAKAKTDAAKTPAKNGIPENGANGETSADAPQGANNGK